jgi:RNA polymerase sigma factor (sigma-70 family)
MLNRQQKVILPHVRRMMGSRFGEELSDGQLVERFLGDCDPAAFAALVRRHARMVLGVCQRILNNAHDAEDAFQATFLVLVRRARSIAKREAVGSWLYGVAYRVALKARDEALRRRKHERQAASLANQQSRPEESWDEVRPIIDEEVNRLPEKYRQPIVLCYFEGKTYEEAAQLLGWPAGTASARLARARELLRSRLTLRGVALSSTALATCSTSGAASAAAALLLADATANAALRLAADAGAPNISSQVIALTEGVVKAMVMRKMTTWAGVFLAVTLTCGSVAVLCRSDMTTLAAAADRPLQAADPSSGPFGSELQVASAPPTDEAATSPPLAAESPDQPPPPAQGFPPPSVAPSAKGALPLHTRIGLINMTRVLKDSKAFQSLQADLNIKSNQAQQDLEILKGQLRRLQAGSDDPARERLAAGIRQLQREIQDEQDRARTKLAKLNGEALTKMYRDVEDVANRIAKANGLELVMFYTDVVTEADFYNPTNLQNKMTRPGALMPMIVAPGMDITESVVEVLGRSGRPHH